ncbi:MAG: SH3 domain-containing protein [Moraxella sp.]|nr:SH3 domain-containing protein [Moraxella sp.]
MQLMTVAKHQPPPPLPTFCRGTPIKNIKPCSSYTHWYACQIAGHDTYMPAHFVRENRLAVDYNPSELAIDKGQIVTLLELHYEWVLAAYQDKVGWLPCKILITIK